MSAIIHQTVRELALEVPGATRVFESAGIDYCCGGGKSLEAACAAAGVDGEEMLEALRALGSTEVVSPADRDFREQSLAMLIDHLVTKHHVFTVNELARLEPLLAKVQSKHGDNHPELATVSASFEKLRDDLLPHMQKEEMVLFPYMTSLEQSHDAGVPVTRPPFMTVANPIRMMMLEHDVAGELLREIRTATADFTLPADACMSFGALYEGLAELERDLHQHIHLENNLLFPRAAAMEAESLIAP